MPKSGRAAAKGVTGTQIQQNEKENWQNSGDKKDRQVDMITIKSPSFNSITLSIITKLKLVADRKRVKSNIS